MTTSTTSAKSSSLACWNCGTPLPATGQFCANCGKLQPVGRQTDYFALLGLPRKMVLDAADIERPFHELSWKLHPDNFAGAGERERELSLQLSSRLNDAYRMLREPLGRIEYLLAQAGLRKEGQQKQQAPPELLEEVFELNESLDELRNARSGGGDGARMASLRKRLEDERAVFDEKLREVDQELAKLSAEWDRAGVPGTEEFSATQRKVMEQMNEVLNRRSYIRNLVEGVKKELAEE
jgi:molecular chaperone HscB